MTKTCDVTGMKLSLNEFYDKQSHCKFVDNLRRGMNFNKKQIKLYLKSK